MTTLLGAPALRVANGKRTGQKFEIGEALRIGRHPYNHISLDDLAASRYHCWITLTGAGFVVQDLDSTNGTFVNGIRIAKRALRPGDRIQVGRTEFVFGED